MKDRLKTSDNQVWFYGIFTPDPHKVMYKDGNRLGMKAKLTYAEKYEEKLLHRSKHNVYLDDNCIVDLIAARKSEDAYLKSNKVRKLQAQSNRLAKYNKKLPKTLQVALDKLLF